MVQESCFVLTFDKNIWEVLLREIFDKQKKLPHTIICSNEIFHHMFNKRFHYYEDFKVNQIMIHSNLINQGDQPENVYIIKQGEFEVNITRSILELSDIIKKIGGKDWNVQRKKYERLLSNNGIIFCFLKCAKILEESLVKFNKLLHEKKQFKVSIVKEKDVIGLDEFILKEKYIFSVKCISIDAEYFSIEKKVSILIKY